MQKKNVGWKHLQAYVENKRLAAGLVEKSSKMAYSVTEPLSANAATDHTLLSSEEQVLMQTATVEVQSCKS